MVFIWPCKDRTGSEGSWNEITQHWFQHCWQVLSNHLLSEIVLLTIRKLPQSPHPGISAKPGKRTETPRPKWREGCVGTVVSAVRIEARGFIIVSNYNPMKISCKISFFFCGFMEIYHEAFPAKCWSQRRNIDGFHDKLY